MIECVRWEDVERELDKVELHDWPAMVAVYLGFEGRLLDPRDTNGRKKAVTVGSFCSHFNISRYHFINWLNMKQEQKETVL